ncbi:MAG: helix-turn-helix transcriptional regulator [Lachnospiraceae bacterium]|nr:helix-turn-helix transcriptional regulator [Lachnospiraceae bacterium]
MIYIENELIGKRLKKIRQEEGMDYVDMGELLGISEGHYRKIERGVYGLDVRKLLILHTKLKVDPMYLLTGKRPCNRYYLGERPVDRNELVCELLDYCKKQLAEDREE